MLTGFYDAGIYIYALSLLFFISDCIRRNRGAKRMGTGLLAVVGMLQAGALIIRALEESALPIFTPFDFLLLLSFSLVVASLIIHLLQRAEFAVLLLSIIGFCIQVLNRLRFSPGNNPLKHWETVHGLLVLHITLANLSFVIFTVATVFSAMYLFLHRKLKGKKWTNTMRRLPSLEMLDKYAYSLALIGTPLLTVSFIVAALSVVAEGRLNLLLDMKVLATFAGLCFYYFYLYKKRLHQHTGTLMAKWILVGYVFIIIIFALNAWSDFHRWNGE
ncbi:MULTISPECIES: cytochrome c biogenesis protein CcsA [Paenibacillus]|uniref:Protein HemX n=1 Tax=Paenibacillus azoreducens TaxID=116718 RepID=A0A920CUQ5_9BACL|nr:MULTISPECIES: cytochrome c biogenesis protein CcsA [Paenibacillus]MBE9918118.1 cytochrome c biogenesis protein CcsA [Paenibacillus donghaensis]GIO49663.1 protein HemX [Paenibacillus azoreducens]